ncbi:MAG: hypothetical protein Harvfovirus52_2 [Harvfovirus sp.]|uniref:DNA primase/polymerase bifunctional N-terminal domain-containing protein n=1 Tax=Harvfovirus sp. TaxID=2487768 RepID=A0A3G5A5A0_9VIRU|nr:MAG: hypothetical protein Harvfovirus52_2 [Harvfovirus sp.]
MEKLTRLKNVDEDEFTLDIFDNGPGLDETNLVYMPINDNTKIAALLDWQHLTKTPAQHIMNKYKNIAILCGEVSGMTGLDVDNKRGGMGEMSEYNAKYGEPMTWKAVTPNGGEHYLFLYVNWTGTRHHVGKNRDWDIQNDGAYLMCAPSTIDNKPYKMIRCKETGHEILPMPETLVFYLCQNMKAKPNKNPNAPTEENIKPEEIYYIDDSDLIKLLNCLPEDKYKHGIGWFAITNILKGLNKREIWEKFSQPSDKYNCDNNAKIWDNMVSFINVNYLIYVINLTIKKKLKYLYPTRRYVPLLDSSIPCKTKILTIDDLDKDKYLLLGNYIEDNKTLIVCSGTGTAKTTSTADLVIKLMSKTPTLFISIISRKSLGGQQVKVFRNDKKMKIMYYEEGFTSEDNLIIQLDSILKISKDVRDYILYIDEINSLLKYLIASSTLDSKRVSIFSKLTELIRNAKRFVCTDADMSDLVFFALFHGPDPLRDSKQSLFVEGNMQNYVGLKAYQYKDENLMIEKMATNIQNKEFFLAAFDKRATMDLYVAKLKMQFPESAHLFRVYSKLEGSEKDFLNATENWEGMYVFYTPRVIYGVDVNPLVKTDVFVNAQCCSIDPSQIAQQMTRCRNINKVSFYIKPVTRQIRFNNVEDVHQHYLKHMKFYEEELLGICAISTTDYYMRDQKINRTLFTDMFYIHKLQDEVLKSNFTFHFMEILKNKGFEIIILENNAATFRDPELMKLIKEQQKNHVDEILMSGVSDDQIYRSILQRLKLLGFDIETMKSEGLTEIITNEIEFNHYINFCKLIRDDSYHKAKVKNQQSNEFAELQMGSSLMKINFCHELERLLGVGVLFVDVIQKKNEFNDEISEGEKILDKYRSIFSKSSRTGLISKWIDGYKLLIECYKHLLGHEFITINLKRIQVRKNRTYEVESVFISKIIEKYLVMYKNNSFGYQNVDADFCDRYKLLREKKFDRNDCVFKSEDYTDDIMKSINIISELHVVKYKYEKNMNLAEVVVELNNIKNKLQSSMN